MKDLEDKLEDLNVASSDIEANWCAARDVLYSTSMEHLGPSVHKRQDWFDQNNTDMQALLCEKHRLYRTYINDQGSSQRRILTIPTTTRRKVQTKVKEMSNAWCSKAAEEIHHYADTNNTKRFNDTLKSIHGAQTAVSSHC